MSKYKKHRQPVPAQPEMRAASADAQHGATPRAVQQRETPPPSSAQTLAQQRAKHALDIVCGIDGNPGFMGKTAASQKKLNSYIASFGPMILMNGFGQACAFYLANNEAEHKEVYDALAQWLCNPGRPYARQQDLMQAIVNGNVASYRLAQAEALAYLDWLKKFAKAFLKSDKEEGGKGDVDASQ